MIIGIHLAPHFLGVTRKVSGLCMERGMGVEAFAAESDPPGKLIFRNNSIFLKATVTRRLCCG